MPTPSSVAKPVVSCIITNYNYGRFITQAIDSVLAQTYPHLEIIIVDDGSTDDSLAIIKSYGARVKLLAQTNQGVVIARNNGARQATGQYLFFLDADDYVTDDYVARLIEAIQTAADNKVAFAYCDFRLTGQTDQVVKSCPWNPRKLLYRNYVIVSALIDKAAFTEVGGFDIAVNQKASFEDWDLWLSLLDRGYSGIYCPSVLFFYRLHGTGRNQAALQQRANLEQVLHRKHLQLYGKISNRLYLLLFANASRFRNAIRRPPGT